MIFLKKLIDIPIFIMAIMMMAIPPMEEPQVVPPEEIQIQIEDVYLDDVDHDLQDMVREACKQYGIDFAFTMAVIHTESRFEPDAVNHDGSCVGLMQVNRCNLEWLGEQIGVTDLFDPEQNVEGGLFILRTLFEKYDDPTKVLMAYNMGEYGAIECWDQGIHSSEYAEGILQQSEIYQEKINERMGYQ